MCPFCIVLLFELKDSGFWGLFDVLGRCERLLSLRLLNNPFPSIFDTLLNKFSKYSLITLERPLSRVWDTAIASISDQNRAHLGV